MQRLEGCWTDSAICHVYTPEPLSSIVLIEMTKNDLIES